MNFAVPANHWAKIKESEKLDKYLDFDQEAEKAVEHEGHGNTDNSWHARNIFQAFGKETGGVEISRRNETVHCCDRL